MINAQGCCNDADCFGLIAICPMARADECFCLGHSTGAILRSLQSLNRLLLDCCTDPETGKRSQQTMYSDWKRIDVTPVCDLLHIHASIAGYIYAKSE
jgi:hypothetical protein